ncbi:MAG: DUF6152 family protein [Pseudomonadota bacterium]|nr:DUF6152 family protein [Pseudomonadota bacterium]
MRVGMSAIHKTSAMIFFMMSSVGASAHHSVSSLYDYDNILSLEGTVQKIYWINPHVRINIEIINENGQRETWRLDGSALNLLQRLGVTRDMLKAGDRIVAKGPASRHGLKAMLASVVIHPDGNQLVMFPGSARRAGLIGPDTTVGYSENEASVIPAPSAKGRPQDMFRVWTPDHKPTTDSGLGIPPWPLRETALAAVAKYDPVNDDPAAACVQAGIPVILDTPYPVEFLKRGDDIVMLTEEWDVERTIHMNSDIDDVAGQQRSPWGYSVGRWENDKLVVTTSNISYPYFDDLGTPQSDQLQIVEHYRFDATEPRLYWEAVATDPEVFTAPVVLKGDMIWVPGEQLKRFDCTIPE